MDNVIRTCVCRAKANAKNYRIASKEKVLAKSAQKAAIKAKKQAQKVAKLHTDKAESIMQVKRQFNAAKERQAELERERNDSVAKLVFERARYKAITHLYVNAMFI